ncbi:MAG TPA: antibiotic biosynthesis monooxygenase [Dehalococcoidia bacterium]|nr:antibiotic biosynthesis monooxygenase [Dehalococcoidia bacterium]
MSEIIELARFKVREGEEAAFLARRPAMLEAARKHLPGLLRIELVKLDGGEWIDVVVWDSREHAENAPAIAAGLPEFAAWMAHIAEDTAMDIGVVHDRAEAAAVAAR